VSDAKSRHATEIMVKATVIVSWIRDYLTALKCHNNWSRLRPLTLVLEHLISSVTLTHSLIR